jgi:hypothetical protein
MHCPSCGFGNPEGMVFPGSNERWLSVDTIAEKGNALWNQGLYSSGR